MSYFESSGTILDYHPLVNSLGSIANVVGVSVCDEDLEQWHMMGLFARGLDTKVDKFGSTSSELEEQVAILTGESPYFSEFSEDMANLFKSMYDQLSSERQEAVNAAPKLATIFHEMQNTSRVTQLIKLKRKEGELFTNLFRLDDRSLNDGLGRRRFNRALVPMTNAGYGLDTVLDLRADYEHEETRVRPTVINRSVLAAFVIQNGVQAGVQVLRPRTILPLYEMFDHWLFQPNT